MPVKFILGTHTLGDRSKDPGLLHFDTAEEVQGLLDAFHSRGYTHIDTARDYVPITTPWGDGAEARLGRAGAPSRFIVDTKVHSGSPGDHERAKIELSIAQSLEALKTSSVETMYLHVPDRQTPFEESAKAMDDALKQGKFKKFGLSNYTADEVRQFLGICEQKGYTKPSVYQGQYNAVARRGEEELFPLLRKHNMAFFAFSPAAGGFFSPQADTSRRWKDDNGIGQRYGEFYGPASVQASKKTVQQAVAKYGLTAHEAALRWTAFHSALDEKYGDAVIVGVSKLEQLHRNLDALEAGPLPADLAEVLGGIYSTFADVAPPYHL